MMYQLNLFTNFKFKRTSQYAGLVCMFIALKYACMHAAIYFTHEWLGAIFTSVKMLFIVITFVLHLEFL